MDAFFAVFLLLPLDVFEYRTTGERGVSDGSLSQKTTHMCLNSVAFTDRLYTHTRTYTYIFIHVCVRTFAHLLLMYQSARVALQHFLPPEKVNDM